MQIKKTAKLLIKIVLPLILILVCLEFLMVVLDPYLFKGLNEYDPDLGFRGAPQFVLQYHSGTRAGAVCKHRSDSSELIDR